MCRNQENANIADIPTRLNASNGRSNAHGAITHTEPFHANLG
jgi:hypothetical protein